VADLTGHLEGTTFVDGLWDGHSTSPTGAIGNGTWTAAQE
jgi:hypothetical protein